MPSPSAPQITFRALSTSDFPLLTRWLAEPHVRRYYQKTPVTLDDVAEEYGPVARGEEPLTLSHLGLLDGTPFIYLQSYRNASYPEWQDLIGTGEGISIDLYLGEPSFVGRGLGRAALKAYVEEVALPHFAGETVAYIAHETTNGPALRCSEAVGFRPLRTFIEEGLEMRLLVLATAPAR